jgi:hypothetical protein
MSPSGEIVKSSIGTFRAQAVRFAAQRKNFTVVKLAIINARVKANAPVVKPVPVEPQLVESDLTASNVPTRGRPRKERKAA